MGTAVWLDDVMKHHCRVRSYRVPADTLGDSVLGKYYGKKQELKASAAYPHEFCRCLSQAFAFRHITCLTDEMTPPFPW